MNDVQLHPLSSFSYSWHKDADTLLPVRLIKASTSAIKAAFFGYSVHNNVETQELMKSHPKALFTTQLKDRKMATYHIQSHVNNESQNNKRMAAVAAGKFKDKLSFDDFLEANGKAMSSELTEIKLSKEQTDEIINKGSLQHQAMEILIEYLNNEITKHNKMATENNCAIVLDDRYIWPRDWLGFVFNEKINTEENTNSYRKEIEGTLSIPFSPSDHFFPEMVRVICDNMNYLTDNGFIYIDESDIAQKLTIKQRLRHNLKIWI